MNERTKKKIKILLFALASAFFLYSGFAMLIEDANKQTNEVHVK
jgi:hypothetical protein